MQGEDLFMKALSTRSNSTELRAKTLLRLELRKVGFVQGMDVYVKGSGGFQAVREDLAPR